MLYVATAESFALYTAELFDTGKYDKYRQFASNATITNAADAQRLYEVIMCTASGGFRKEECPMFAEVLDRSHVAAGVTRIEGKRFDRTKVCATDRTATLYVWNRKSTMYEMAYVGEREAMWTWVYRASLYMMIDERDSRLPTCALQLLVHTPVTIGRVRCAAKLQDLFYRGLEMLVPKPLSSGVPPEDMVRAPNKRDRPTPLHIFAFLMAVSVTHALSPEQTYEMVESMIIPQIREPEDADVKVLVGLLREYLVFGTVKTTDAYKATFGLDFSLDGLWTMTESIDKNISIADRSVNSLAYEVLETRHEYDKDGDIAVYIYSGRIGPTERLRRRVCNYLRAKTQVSVNSLCIAGMVENTPTLFIKPKAHTLFQAGLISIIATLHQHDLHVDFSMLATSACVSAYPYRHYILGVNDPLTIDEDALIAGLTAATCMRSPLMCAIHTEKINWRLGMCTYGAEVLKWMNFIPVLPYAMHFRLRGPDRHRAFCEKSFDEAAKWMAGHLPTLDEENMTWLTRFMCLSLIIPVYDLRWRKVMKDLPVIRFSARGALIELTLRRQAHIDLEKLPHAIVTWKLNKDLKFRDDIMFTDLTKLLHGVGANDLFLAAEVLAGLDLPFLAVRTMEPFNPLDLQNKRKYTKPYTNDPPTTPVYRETDDEWPLANLLRSIFTEMVTRVLVRLPGGKIYYKRRTMQLHFEKVCRYPSDSLIMIKNNAHRLSEVTVAEVLTNRLQSSTHEFSNSVHDYLWHRYEKKYDDVMLYYRSLLDPAPIKPWTTPPIPPPNPMYAKARLTESDRALMYIMERKKVDEYGREIDRVGRPKTPESPRPLEYSDLDEENRMDVDSDSE